MVCIRTNDDVLTSDGSAVVIKCFTKKKCSEQMSSILTRSDEQMAVHFRNIDELYHETWAIRDFIIIIYLERVKRVV